MKKGTKNKAKQLVADAGYGSEENYEMLESKEITAYVKYNYFHKEQKKKMKDNRFVVQNLFYIIKQKDVINAHLEVCAIKFSVRVRNRLTKVEIYLFKTVTEYFFINQPKKNQFLKFATSKRLPFSDSLITITRKNQVYMLKFH
ncbi:hypothetical protein [Myroides guanonis]|uniref:hypothetical protein n=1 Tax=Myroides guanonis TaxID=1150112 RepID=UPI001C4328F6|nr:hypothetical protein [Myroides guanonis]